MCSKKEFKDWVSSCRREHRETPHYVSTPLTTSKRFGLVFRRGYGRFYDAGDGVVRSSPETAWGAQTPYRAGAFKALDEAASYRRQPGGKGVARGCLALARDLDAESRFFQVSLP